MKRAAIVCMLGLLAACAGPAPRTQFYTLDSERGSSAAGSSAATAPKVKVSVWQVSIPEVADRAQLVVRTAPNRVDVSDFHRWAEPLNVGVARVVSDDLAARLGGGFLVVAGQPAGLQPDIRVSLDVQKFEAVPGQGVSVEALWVVRPAKGEPRAGRSVADEPSQRDAKGEKDDYAAIAAAYSRALARIATDLGHQIEALTP